MVALAQSVAVILCFAAKPARAQNTNAPEAAPGQLIVQFKSDANEAARKNALDKVHGKVKKRVHTPVMKSRGHPGLDVIETTDPLPEAIDKLKSDPAVEFAEPNWHYRHQTVDQSDVPDAGASAVANDTYYTSGYLWGLADTGSNSFGTRVSTAWTAGYTGSNSVYVGVIDEGIQWDHPDLAANIWTNPFEPADGRDNDGNGYVDDVHGWDFYSGDNSIYDAGGDEHGTHVSGTIGAIGGNARGVAGVNWHVTIISGKFLGAGGGYTEDAIAAIDYFVDLKERHGLNIVALNNSWGGGGYSQAMNDAVIRAAKAGILFVVAAGNGDAYGRGLNNDSVANYPSNYDTSRGTSTETAAGYNAVIAVAAIDQYGALASFSNYGSRTVHIGAPGVSILSTVPGGYNYMDGTSMATPHVTGAVALYASTHPGQSATQIRTAILSGARPTASLAGKTSTGGRLDLSSVILPNVTLAKPLPGTFQNAGRTNNQFRVLFSGVVGKPYELQTSSDLKTWTPVSTFTNTLSLMQLTDTMGIGKKFYRALSK